MPKSSEHTARIKTAAILLAAVLAIGILDIPLLTWLFLGVAYYFAMDEAVALFRIGDTTPYPFGAVIWIVAGFYPQASDLMVLGLLVFAALLAYRRRLDPRSFLPLLYPTIGLLYTWMLYREYGMVSLLWMLLVVALADVGAYYTGKKFGKTPFSPTSPNKTLEGVAGGVIAGTIGGTIIAAGWMEVGFFAALIISLIGTKFSIFGDLFESYLKREANVKDSGTILPGHGGVLDRIDGYLFAAPALYILLRLFGY
jgi:phosphatidate cytidylyltransferase